MSETRAAIVWINWETRAAGLEALLSGVNVEERAAAVVDGYNRSRPGQTYACVLRPGVPPVKAENGPDGWIITRFGGTDPIFYATPDEHADAGALAAEYQAATIEKFDIYFRHNNRLRLCLGNEKPADFH